MRSVRHEWFTLAVLLASPNLIGAEGKWYQFGVEGSRTVEMVSDQGPPNLVLKEAWYLR
jgi:hypothetical protein